MIQVAHVIHVAGAAPFLKRLVEVVAEHAAPDVEVIGLDAFGFGGERVDEQGGDIGLEVIAFLGFEGFKEFGGPGEKAGVVGFVEAKAEDGFAEFIADGFAVFFVDEFEIGGGGLGVEEIDEGVEAVFVGGAVLAVGEAGGGTAIEVAYKGEVPGAVGAGGGPVKGSVGGDGDDGGGGGSAAASAASATTAAGARGRGDGLGIGGNGDGECGSGDDGVVGITAGGVEDDFGGSCRWGRAI